MADGIREPLPPGWYPDPWDVHPFRRHDGHEWTNDVADQPPQTSEPTHAAPRGRRRRRKDSAAACPAQPAPALTVSGGPVRLGATLVPPAQRPAEPARRSRVKPLLGLLVMTSAGAGGWYVLTQTDYEVPFAAAERPRLVESAEAGSTPEAELPAVTQPALVDPNSTSAGPAPSLQADLFVALECHDVGVTYSVGDVLEPALYVLDYGDGVVVSTPRPADDPFFGVHSYTASGHYTVKLGVLSADGHIGSADCTIDHP